MIRTWQERCEDFDDSHITTHQDVNNMMMEEIEELRAVFRDAYEVWAGSEGIPKPVTAAEAYLLQLLSQMRDEVKRGLK